MTFCSKEDRLTEMVQLCNELGCRFDIFDGIDDLIKKLASRIQNVGREIRDLLLDDGHK